LTCLAPTGIMVIHKKGSSGAHPMVQKRDEAVERQESGLPEQSLEEEKEEDREETKIDKSGDAHEKAKRRKRGKTRH